MNRSSILTLIALLATPPLAHSAANPADKGRGIKSIVNNQPEYHRRIHHIGNLYSKIGNDAKIGGVGGLDPNDTEYQLIGHDALFEFPAGTRNDYLFGGSLWIGGIVGDDTLVSEALDGASETAFEFNSFTSISETYEQVAGRQTFTAYYSDTLVLPTTSDEIALRLHKPLGLAITQQSHAFKTAPYNEFVIVEYTIRNISPSPISQVYVGVVADADVWPQTGSVDGSGGPTDDLAGFLRDDCIAYAIDNDGDPQSVTFDGYGNPVPLPETSWVAHSMRGAFAIAPLKFIPEPVDTSFNWWATNFSSVNWGPSKNSSPVGTVGVPRGDVNRYYTMSNRECDYDQLWSAVDMTHDAWRPGASLPQLQTDLANGQDTRILLSFGAFELAVGDSIRAVFALAAGADIHATPNSFTRNFTEYDPSQFFGTLDFSKLKANVDRARRIYDLGFQLPGAPPTQFFAKPFNQNSVRCSWTRAPFEGVTAYRLYRRQSGGQFAPVASLGAADTAYIDWNLSIGTTYEYAISALDSSGDESGISFIAAATPGRPIEIPSVSAKSIRGLIHVNCNTAYAPDSHAKLGYINLYRRAENAANVELIHRIPVPQVRNTPGLPGKHNPGIVGIARARDDQWPRDPSLDSLFPQYVDSDAVSGTRYFYSASVSNTLGLEGDRSGEVSALSMAMDRRGLVLFHTITNPSTLIDRDSLRSFYSAWAEVRAFDTVWYNFRLPPSQADLAIPLEKLSHQQIVIVVMEDDPSRILRPWSPTTGLFRWLSDYSSAGGRIVLVARNADSQWSSDAHSLLRHFAGVGQGHRELWAQYVGGGTGSWETHVRFQRAHSNNSNYPPLDGDSAKAHNFQLIADVIALPGNDYIGGKIPAVGYLDDLHPGTEVLYTFGGVQPDTSFFEGRTVGVRRLTDSTGGVIMFAFPLSLIKYDQAWNALSIAADDLGADTTWTALTPFGITSAAMLQWLYKPGGNQPDNAWDINRDGIIDIRDVVMSLGK